MGLSSENLWVNCSHGVKDNKPITNTYWSWGNLPCLVTVCDKKFCHVALSLLIEGSCNSEWNIKEFASGKCRSVVQGGPECSWSTKGGCGPRGPPGPLWSILIHSDPHFLKFYRKCGPGWTWVDQEDHGDHNHPRWTRTGFYILLMLPVVEVSN